VSSAGVNAANTPTGQNVIIKLLKRGRDLTCKILTLHDAAPIVEYVGIPVTVDTTFFNGFTKQFHSIPGSSSTEISDLIPVRIDNNLIYKSNTAIFVNQDEINNNSRWDLCATVLESMVSVRFYLSAIR
jgi:hypothetical protein